MKVVNSKQTIKLQTTRPSSFALDFREFCRLSLSVMPKAMSWFQIPLSDAMSARGDDTSWRRHFIYIYGGEHMIFTQRRLLAASQSPHYHLLSSSTHIYTQSPPSPALYNPICRLAPPPLL